MLQETFDAAVRHHQEGRLAEAEPLYLKMLADDPQLYPALHLFGLLRLQQGQTDEAVALMERALAAQPGAIETMANYALALSAANRTEEALAAFGTVIAGRPTDARPLNNRGGLYFGKGQHAEALADFDAALALEPRYLEALNNSGLSLLALGRPDKARERFARALEAMPGYLDARTNHGLCLRELGRHEDALKDFEAVLNFAPENVGAWVNRAATLWDLGRVDEALASYERVLALNPDQPDALAGRGELRWARKRELGPAIADLERALKAAPDLAYARGNLLQMKMYAADWDGFAEQKTHIDTGVRASQPVVEPFIYDALSDSPADLQACAAIYAGRKFPARPPLRSGTARRPGKIRIGYVSGEFRAQATAYLAAGLYEAHDRDRFEVIAFDNSVPDGSAMRARLEKGFDRMIDIAAMSDAAAAARIASEDIDILVNLNGYFGRMRMGVFAHRPAPIQVNYLGFPGTLGVPYIDYILADQIVIPESERAFYTEKVMWLPGSYQINDDKRGVPTPAPAREALGLPNGGFVFCHFNYGYKIHPQMFALWMRLLDQVPNSVLWLLETHALFAENTRAAAAKAGIDPARLIFAPQLPLEQHLSRLAAGDLFLDCLPCGAHTTASDALWAGLPLLTARGNSFAGRVASSLLLAAGLPELVADDLAAYEACALTLAKEPQQLAALRAKVGAARRTSLFDTRATTRAIETAYAEMFAQWQGGAKA